MLQKNNTEATSREFFAHETQKAVFENSIIFKRNPEYVIIWSFSKSIHNLQSNTLYNTAQNLIEALLGELTDTD